MAFGVFRMTQNAMLKLGLKTEGSLEDTRREERIGKEEIPWGLQRPGGRTAP